jgi:uncharacterized protein
MAGLGKKKKKKKFDYYDAFDAQVALAVKETKLLKGVISEFETASALEKELSRAHAIEREADGICHSVFEALLPDFVTPLDREDIIGMTESLDELIDMTEEIIRNFYMFDVHYMHEDAKKFSKLIVRATEALSEAMADFRNCKKSSKFKQLLVRVHDIEDEADQIYMRIIRELYTAECDHPVRIMVWSRLFGAMEDCVDQCELVANKMNTIMVKYA